MKKELKANQKYLDESLKRLSAELKRIGHEKATGLNITSLARTPAEPLSALLRPEGRFRHLSLLIS